MKTFHIVIFGCQMNYADSARIKSVLTHCGRTYTDDEKAADILIFDTCSVRQKSEDKITGKLQEVGSHQKIWITGCMIQHNLRTGKIEKNKKIPESLKKGNFLERIQTKTPEVCGYLNDDMELRKTDTKERVFINHAFNPMFHRFTQKCPQVELFWRIDDTGFLPLIMNKIGYDVSYEEGVVNEYNNIIPEGINNAMNAHGKTAYVPISTGCNQFCSYCIVPYARGLEKHLSKEQILKEVSAHLASGIKEIVLLGQIVNKHPEFVEIIKAILQLEGLEWLRYTSPYPNYYTPELLQLHETEPKLCPHIHIPFQSGSTPVLKAMCRGYTAEQARVFIDNIRGLKREISITTDIIVGFPNETEEDFQQTLDLVRYGKFDMIYIGIYSPRPGTLAHKNIPDSIDRKTKRDRRNRLNSLLKEISQENNIQEIGKTRPCIIDTITAEGIFGYTDNMKQITMQTEDRTQQNTQHTSESFHAGMIVSVKITQGGAFKLVGKLEK